MGVVMFGLGTRCLLGVIMIICTWVGYWAAMRLVVEWEGGKFMHQTMQRHMYIPYQTVCIFLIDDPRYHQISTSSSRFSR